jgi:hypothetical protein
MRTLPSRIVAAVDGVELVGHLVDHHPVVLDQRGRHRRGWDPERLEQEGAHHHGDDEGADDHRNPFEGVAARRLRWPMLTALPSVGVCADTVGRLTTLTAGDPIIDPHVVVGRPGRAFGRLGHGRRR